MHFIIFSAPFFTDHAIRFIVVGSKLPVVGHMRSTGYEGDGYMIVRHERTAVVERALQHIISTVHVECG